MTSRHLHLWESALLMAFALTFLAGAYLGAGQDALAERVLRLHVVANSDSPEDQSLKLQVRDAVLRRAEPLLAGVNDRQAAEEILRAHLSELAQEGRETLDRAGCGDEVTVSIADLSFPTKTYEGFALPAGEYRALRVVIGAGEGQNWWCVVFPSLCMASVQEEVAAAAASGGLRDDQIALITGKSGGYVLKFKVIEWWEELRQKLKW